MPFIAGIKNLQIFIIIGTDVFSGTWRRLVRHFIQKYRFHRQGRRVGHEIIWHMAWSTQNNLTFKFFTTIFGGYQVTLFLSKCGTLVRSQAQLCLYALLKSRSTMWSGGQSSWLQIQRSGFDSRLYQIFWEVVGLERGPFSLLSKTEELLERKSSGSGLESRD
jgi:hypothetical protein